MSDKNSIFPAINADIVKGRWEEIKGKIKQTWAKITDDDILKMKGSYEELHGVLQQKYGYEKDHASKEIHEFLDKKGFKDAAGNLAAAKQDLKNAKDNITGK